jgi:phosphoglycerate-specific signal transduction histidine kinase
MQVLKDLFYLLCWIFGIGTVILLLIGAANLVQWEQQQMKIVHTLHKEVRTYGTPVKIEAMWDGTDTTWLYNGIEYNFK